MSIVAVLEQFKPLIKLRNTAEKAVTDNTVFRLHYRTTSLILFVCCAFVTTYTIFGDPIECVGEFKDGKAKVINTFCYLQNTYTIPENQPSVKEKKYYSYYRWIPQMLFLQGVLFYLPHWIWKMWENKKITHLTNNVRGPIVKMESAHEDRLQLLAKYAAESLHTHNMLALKYYFCEILNFLNVILNMYLTDKFLNGEFMKYGIDVLNLTNMDQDDRTDPMIKIFPRITKCDFQQYGPSGSIQKFDFMCILALNNLNEKIYIFLWFWFIILALVSILPIAYNIAIFLSPSLRIRELSKHNILDQKFRTEELIEKAEIGDFFLWVLMGRNMSSKCYREFINQLYKSLIPNEKEKETNRNMSGNRFSYETNFITFIFDTFTCIITGPTRANAGPEQIPLSPPLSQ